MILDQSKRAGLLMISGTLAENEVTFQIDQVFSQQKGGTITP